MIYMIVAGGNVDIEFTKGFFREFDGIPLFVIACDKGYEACEAMEIRPNLVVGDFDSAGGSAADRAKEAGIEVVQLNPIKDDTDTEAALDIAIGRSTKYDEIYLLGASGTRLDHTMGNIALLGKGLVNDRVVILQDPHNRIEMITAGDTYAILADDQFGKYVSVFPYMGPVRGLKMKGFKYPLEDCKLEGFNTLTVSNELEDYEGIITIEKGFLIVMQTRD